MEMSGGFRWQGIVGFRERSDEIGEVCKPGVFQQGGSPFDKIREIHVCSDVLHAGISIHRFAFKALVEEVGAERAMGSAVVEPFCCFPVVNGEELSPFPILEPGFEPEAV